jgi:hypothetical protein
MTGLKVILLDLGVFAFAVLGVVLSLKNRRKP